MSNRLLALLILVVIFGGLYGAFYYFFVANVGGISVVVTGIGTGSVAVEMQSDLKQTYRHDCQKICTFPDMPPVGYSLTAKAEGYVPVEKSFSVTRGVVTKVIVRMDPEVKLSPIEGLSDSGVTESGTKTPTADDLPSIVTMETGPIETIDGEPVKIPGTIYAVKTTSDPTTRLVTTDRGVFIYSTEDRSARENPLYDDLLPLASGDLIALVRKTSKSRLSLLNLDTNGNDYILLVNIERRTRKVLLQTQATGKYLDYRDKKVILIDADGKKFEVKNAQ